MKKKKNNFSTIMLVVVFVAGLSLLLYPTVSNWYNTSLYSKEIGNYTRVTSSAKREEIEKIFAQADEYNEKIRESKLTFGVMTDEQLEEYHSQLNLTKTDDDSMMGYISIPKINVSLPIFHGTDEAVLNSGIGHLEGSSLPIGGKGTHSVLSGHRGLPSSRIFTDLDKMVVGDTFSIEILGRTYFYQVDQITIILPEETSTLRIDPDGDYCTLLTCTPYGVNSHRLLVRGARVDNPRGNITVTADAIQIERTTVAIVFSVPTLLIRWIIAMAMPVKKKENEYEEVDI